MLCCNGLYVLLLIWLSIKLHFQEMDVPACVLVLLQISPHLPKSHIAPDSELKRLDGDQEAVVFSSISKHSIWHFRRPMYLQARITRETNAMSIILTAKSFNFSIHFRICSKYTGPSGLPPICLVTPSEVRKTSNMWRPESIFRTHQNVVTTNCSLIHRFPKPRFRDSFRYRILSGILTLC